MIPNVAHFVFGLAEQDEPFHPLYAVAIESCRQTLRPERIYLHYKHLPWGPEWDRVRPHLTLAEVDLVEEVLSTDYSSGLVPEPYRYAHHADCVRLDALIEHGGIYVDIDTIFIRPIPAHLYEQPFVIGRESSVLDHVTGIAKESLCNALLMAEPGAAFARTWRHRIAGALNGTWSNHSGFLSEELSREMPDAVHVEPSSTFFPFAPDAPGLAALLREHHGVPPAAVSVHLWAHLWWLRERRDFSPAHAGWCTPEILRDADTSLGELARPFLPPELPRSAGAGGGWLYVSLDETSGYGVAADRCRAALAGSGLEMGWLPFVPGSGWGLFYEPGFPLRPTGARATTGEAEPSDSSPVVVAHLVPEFFPRLRAEFPDALLVGHTVWETDRLPEHWPACLEATDLVVVPSAFSAAPMESAGLGTPVAVVPHVAPDVDGVGSHHWLGVADDVTVFYTIAEWTDRKAVFHTIEAFLRAFSGRDNVLLVVKTTALDLRSDQVRRPGVGRTGTTPFAVAGLLAGRADPPAIRLVTRPLSSAQVTGLHRRGDAYVSLARAEGWGLGAFDAAAFGNPVVTTAFGGQLDYLGDSPHLVDYRLVPVQENSRTASYTAEQHWAEADLDHAARLLRRIAEDPSAARADARRRASRLLETYSPAAVARAMRAAVDGVRAGTPRSEVGR